VAGRDCGDLSGVTITDAQYVGPAMGVFVDPTGFSDELYRSNGTDVHINYQTDTVTGTLTMDGGVSGTHTLTMNPGALNGDGTFNATVGSWDNAGAMNIVSSSVNGSAFGDTDPASNTDAAPTVGGNFHASGADGTIGGVFVGDKQ
jgi:hypothetical protein